MSSNPWDKFFWNDWENDPALKLCGFAAQGLWMRILCICAKAEPKGYLVVAGRPLSATDLAALAGKALPEVETLLVELGSFGVFSTDRKGRIYNRRMVRCVKKSRTAVENGRLGGNPTLLKQTVIPPLDNQELKPQDKPQKPEARSQEPAAEARAREETSNQLHRLVRLLGLNDGDWKVNAAGLRTLIDLKAEGCDFDRHILPAAKACAGRGKSVAYIRPKARELRDAASALADLPPPFEPASDADWVRRLRVFRDKEMWSPKWGPAPDQPGCKCPAEILNAKEAA